MHVQRKYWMCTSFGDTKWRGVEELCVFKIFARPTPTPTALPTALPAGVFIAAGSRLSTSPNPANAADSWLPRSSRITSVIDSTGKSQTYLVFTTCSRKHSILRVPRSANTSVVFIVMTVFERRKTGAIARRGRSSLAVSYLNGHSRGPHLRLSFSPQHWAGHPKRSPNSENVRLARYHVDYFRARVAHAHP